MSARELYEAAEQDLFNCRAGQTKLRKQIKVLRIQHQKAIDHCKQFIVLYEHLFENNLSLPLGTSGIIKNVRETIAKSEE